MQALQGHQQSCKPHGHTSSSAWADGAMLILSLCHAACHYAACAIVHRGQTLLPAAK